MGMSSGFASVAVPLLCVLWDPTLMPETCVFWQRGGADVDRRGNNNENTTKSRLHTFKPPHPHPQEKKMQ